MPTGAKPPDQRHDRYLGTSKWAPPPGTSNGPTEAINGRLEHLRSSALGFRNLTNYIARAATAPNSIGPTHRSIEARRLAASWIGLNQSISPWRTSPSRPLLQQPPRAA